MYRYLLLTAVLLSGCAAITPHQQQIQQGQQITVQQLAELSVGMPLSEVQAVLGMSTLPNIEDGKVNYVIDQDGSAALLTLHHENGVVTEINAP